MVKSDNTKDWIEGNPWGHRYVCGECLVLARYLLESIIVAHRCQSEANSRYLATRSHLHVAFFALATLSKD